MEESKQQKNEDKDRLKERDVKFANSNHLTRTIILAILAAIAILFFIGIVPRLYQQHQLAEKASENPPVQVVAMQVKSIDAPIELILPSTIDAIHTTPIWARVNGYILNFYHDIGDYVVEGDLLAEIETPELDQQYEQATADIIAAEARRNIAKISADRWIELHKDDPEAIAKQEVDQRIAELESAEALVASAKANAERYKKTLEFKRILAPFSGIIIERNIDIGSLITAGSSNNPQQLFKIAKTDILRVFVDVPQKFFRQIKDNLEVEVSVNEFQNRSFKGIVARFAKALDPTARTLRTEVHIENPSLELFVGLYAEVKFLLKPDNPYFLIPTAALILRDEGPKVALIDQDNILHIQPVILGLDHGNQMEILSGLKDNDRIVTILSCKIVDGAKVQIIK